MIGVVLAVALLAWVVLTALVLARMLWRYLRGDEEMQAGGRIP